MGSREQEEERREMGRMRHTKKKKLTRHMFYCMNNGGSNDCKGGR